jgi:hypothetical protein
VHRADLNDRGAAPTMRSEENWRSVCETQARGVAVLRTRYSTWARAVWTSPCTGAPRRYGKNVRRCILAYLLVGATACSTASEPKDLARDSAPPDASAGPMFFQSPSDDAGDEDADLGIACSGAAPPFGAAVAPILAGCVGGELCHGFPSPPYLYGQLVGAPSSDGCDAGVLVAPGNIQRSYLLHKVTGIAMCPGTQRMPPGQMMSRADVQTITDWICAGAPND